MDTLEKGLQVSSPFSVKIIKGEDEIMKRLTSSCHDFSQQHSKGCKQNT
jgi:hypothetical protein